MARGTRFRFVDFAAAAQPGFRNHVVTVEEVRGFCPYAERLTECADYRDHTPRSGRGP